MKKFLQIFAFCLATSCPLLAGRHVSSSFDVSVSIGSGRHHSCHSHARHVARAHARQSYGHSRCYRQPPVLVQTVYQPVVYYVPPPPPVQMVSITYVTPCQPVYIVTEGWR